MLTSSEDNDKKNVKYFTSILHICFVSSEIKFTEAESKFECVLMIIIVSVLASIKAMYYCLVK